MKLRSIEILEKDSNKKGDLFSRLMSDLFHTLGYDEPRLDIHKSGREIDLSSYHRTENKIAIAECKAHAESIGGADINKFIGVIDAEKRKLKKEAKTKHYNLIGYFISLSGFKETAIEQENEFNNKRVILIKPDKLVEELIHGRILVSPEKAISSLAGQSAHLSLLTYADLLAYEKGWIWSFYYSDCDGQKPTHFALVHAEGKPLLKELAEEIINVDTNLNKLFNDLILLNDKKTTIDNFKDLQQANEKYFKYLEHELGEIQFEGLPTDKEAGTVKVKLENIFVPLQLSLVKPVPKKETRNHEDITSEGIGSILSKNSKLAILAKPGGGKSTLLKRIAIAYAFPERRKLVNDELPDKNWFPIFLRCRELGENATSSITNIINGISARAEIHSCSDTFSILTSTALQNGNALLLIDGLDEIAEDKNRITFVNQLRTFIATYPTISIIVTSREAGFRVVAGSLDTYCEKYSVSNLNESEIKELCLKWHKAIIDSSENTIKEASKLSELILNHTRIKVLAENPLLLTTLLFVKRWAGYLPTKRSVLYQEMIKLLLVTWNVEGHEILDIEEAEPQLAYVAYWMTKNGQQTITAEDLTTCLINARQQMPEILGYTKISPSEFIKRVELRSSLLIMSGHKRLDSGNLTAVYEFLHLSFQEYLTAKAVVKRFIPKTDLENKVVDILKPHIKKENWKEVVPLTAVLLERDTKELIEYLIIETKTISSGLNVKLKEEDKLPAALLGQCIANEIQISPEILDTAIEWYAKSNIYERSVYELILNNKFGTAFRKKVKSLFFDKYDDQYCIPLGSILSDIFLIDLRSSENKSPIPDQILSALKSEVKEDKCTAILGMMNFAYDLYKLHNDEAEQIEIPKDIFRIILEHLNIDDLHFRLAVAWCISWLAQADLLDEEFRISFTITLVKLWIKAGDKGNLNRSISWTLYKILTPTIPKSELLKIKKLKTVIQGKYVTPPNEYDKMVSLFLGTIIGITFETSQINELFKRHEGFINTKYYYQFQNKLMNVKQGTSST